jgi:hypothetical protein
MQGRGGIAGLPEVHAADGRDLVGLRQSRQLAELAADLDRACAAMLDGTQQTVFTAEGISPAGSRTAFLTGCPSGFSACSWHRDHRGHKAFGCSDAPDRPYG